jgi:hypothetical protein
LKVSSRRGSLLARAIMACMLRQSPFAIKEQHDDHTVPVSDLDGCLLEGIYRGSLERL